MPKHVQTLQSRSTRHDFTYEVSYASVSSLRHSLWNHKTEGRTINYVKERNPKLHDLLDEFTMTEGTEKTTSTTSGKKNGLQVYYEHTSTSRGRDYYCRRSQDYS